MTPRFLADSTRYIVSPPIVNPIPSPILLLPVLPPNSNATVLLAFICNECSIAMSCMRFIDHYSFALLRFKITLDHSNCPFIDTNVFKKAKSNGIINVYQMRERSLKELYSIPTTIYITKNIIRHLQNSSCTIKFCVPPE